MRTCKTCGDEKPLEEFHKHKRSLGGRIPYCKECEAEKARRWRVENPEKELRNKLFYKYGLELEQYLEMVEAQNNVCAACGYSETRKHRLSVDHDHSCCSGQKVCGECIRGLLCYDCNIALGMLKDDEERVLGLYNYIKRVKHNG